MRPTVKIPGDGNPNAGPEFAPVTLQWLSGGMSGPPVQESAKKLADLKGIFFDRAALALLDPDKEIYRVRWWAPVSPGDEGGLFWGVTILQPGKVGDEYFMTHGHFHANRTRAEFYTPVRGKGLLLRMDEQRRTWGEEMAPGTLHAISGRHAHRVVNVGDEPLIFWACWGSDAGYDYAVIRERGFGARVVEHNGRPALVPSE